MSTYWIGTLLIMGALLELAGMTRGDWPNVVVLPPNDDSDPAVN